MTISLILYSNGNYCLAYYTTYIVLYLQQISLYVGGKTPDPQARTYTDVMKEQSLKKQEVIIRDKNLHSCI